MTQNMDGFDRDLIDIKKAQDGDLAAENAVLTAYAPLVKAIARSYFVIGIDGDDLVQTGMIGLMRAVRTFREDEAAGFKTYAGRCIRNAILDAIRKQKSAPVSDVDLEDVFLPSEEQEPSRLYIEDETARILSETIASVLSEREADVLKLYLNAMSYREISERLGMEQKQVDNTIYSFKKKIKKILQANKNRD